MANEQNLKRGNPETQFKAGRKQTENARKAGIASGEAKRRKKGIREAMQALLDSSYNITDKNTGEVRVLTGEEAIALSIMQEAMNKKSKNWPKAVQFALQLAGEDKSKVEKELIEANVKILNAKADMLTSADTTTLDKLDSILKEMRAEAEKSGDT